MFVSGGVNAWWLSMQISGTYGVDSCRHVEFGFKAKKFPFTYINGFRASEPGATPAFLKPIARHACSYEDGSFSSITNWEAGTKHDSYLLPGCSLHQGLEPSNLICIGCLSCLCNLRLIR
ncbi:hypothetical protein ES702_03572 [subsurface metagenome]